MPVGNGRRGDDEKTTWYKVIAFGKTAEFVSEHFVKGKPIYVTGRIELNEWETKEGEKKVDLQLIADRVQFVPSTWEGGDKEEEQPRQTARGQQREQAPARGADRPNW